MAESSTTTETSNSTFDDTSAVAGDESRPTNSTSSPEGRAGDGSTSEEAAGTSSPPRRKVYESSLLPDRRRRHAPRWLVLLIIAAVIGGVGYWVYGTHGRRAVPTAGKMVYVAADTPGGNTRLWLADLDGSKAEPLSPETATDDSPAFSPDGNQIAYVSTDSSGSRQIFVMDADGKNAQEITRNSGSKMLPAFAPYSNQLLAYTSGGVLYDADLVSGDTERLIPPAEKASDRGGDKNTDTDDSSNTMTIEQFQWAPGAKKREDQALAASVEMNLGQVLEILPNVDKDPIANRQDAQGNPTNYPLAAAGTLTVGWSHDGALIGVALMGTIPGQMSTILLFNAAGEATQKPLVSPDIFFQRGSKILYGPEHPVFSPDDSQIVYEKWAEPDLASRHCEGLYSVDVDGDSPPKQLVPGDAEKAQYTPDGQSILYLVKRADGGHDLWQVGQDGSNPRRLSDGKQDITDFSISPQKG